MGSYDCVCGAGYTGDGTIACIDIDECAAGTGDCDAMATCSNTVGAFAGKLRRGAAAENLEDLGRE